MVRIFLLSLCQNYRITRMKTILKFLLAAFVLSIMPTTNVCAQEEQTECNKRLLSCGKFYGFLAD